MKRTSLLLTVFCFFACLPAQALMAQSPNPNVLFIAVDDLNHWVGHLGRNPRTSLRPLLADPKAAWSLPAITTHGRGNHSVRTDHWRYIRYADGSEELYDHTKDPFEWTNLASKPELAEVKAQLAAHLPNREAPVSTARANAEKKKRNRSANQQPLTRC